MYRLLDSSCENLKITDKDIPEYMKNIIESEKKNKIIEEVETFERQKLITIKLYYQSNVNLIIFCKNFHLYNIISNIYIYIANFLFISIIVFCILLIKVQLYIYILLFFFCYLK